MNAIARELRWASLATLLILLCACERTVFENAPAAAAAACDSSLVGRWLSQGDNQDDDGELEALVGTDCSLTVIEHEQAGPKRSTPTTLRHARQGGVAYLWVDAAWANRSFDVDTTVIDHEGDVYLFAYRLRKDELQLASPPPRALAHRVLDKDIPGEVLMHEEELAVRVKGDSEAIRKVLGRHRLYRFDDPMRFRRATEDDAR